MKVDQTADLLTIFSATVTMRFKEAGVVTEKAG